MNLRSQLSQLKDVLPMEQRSGVVYEIPCSTCDKSYTGKTIRRLGSRLKEHVESVRRTNQLWQSTLGMRGTLSHGKK